MLAIFWDRNTSVDIGRLERFYYIYILRKFLLYVYIFMYSKTSLSAYLHSSPIPVTLFESQMIANTIQL